MSLCSYNGVSFLDDAKYKSTLSCRPVLDAAERTTKYVTYTLRVEGHIVTPNSSDGKLNAKMETWRSLLLRPGGELYYSDVGWGQTFRVNAGSAYDVKWGPTPLSLNVVWLGGDGIAARVTFEIEWHLPPCEENAQLAAGMLALTYSVRFSRTKAGWMQEHVSGTCESALTRLGQTNRVPPAQGIDKFRDSLAARKPAPGWQRGPISLEISPDRRVCNFEWTDTQLPKPLPDKVAEIDADEEVTSGVKNGAFRRWTVRLTARITMAAGFDDGDALGVFLSICDARLFSRAEKRALWVQDFTARDSIFGTTHSFSLTATLTDPAARIGQFLAAADMWRPIPNTSHARWARSVEPVDLQGVRGFAGAEYDASREDYIIDLCDKKNDVRAITPRKSGGANQRRRTVFPAIKKPAPAEAWLWWRNNITIIEQNSVVPHKPLTPNPVQPVPGGLPKPGQGGSLRPFDTPDAAGGAAGGAVPSLRPFPESKPSAVAPLATDAGQLAERAGPPGFNEAEALAAGGPDIVQRVASPMRYAIMEGEGFRLGHEVPAPKLISVGGVKVVEMHRAVSPDVILTLSDPIHHTWWRIVYFLPEAPSGRLPILANPMDGGKKGG